MRIVVVEDNYLNAEDTRDTLLASGIPDDGIEIGTSEKWFRDRLERDWVAEPPDGFVIDVMLRWTDNSGPIVAPPPEVAAASYFRAGLRCAKLVRTELGANPSIALLTVLPRKELEPDFSRLGKVLYIFKSDRAHRLERWATELLRRR